LTGEKRNEAMERWKIRNGHEGAGIGLILGASSIVEELQTELISQTRGEALRKVSIEAQ